MGTSPDERSILPSVVPIVPIQAPHAFDDRWYTFELKYDGFRGLFYVTNGRGHFESKQQKQLTGFKWLIKRLLDELPVHDAIFDGEIVVFDEAERPVFLDLIERRREPSYVAFDLLWLNGKDLRGMPLRERRKQLVRILPEDRGTAKRAVSVNQKGIDFFSHVASFDLEGVVAKRLADPYATDTEWIKILNPDYSQRRDGRWKIFQAKKK